MVATDQQKEGQQGKRGGGEVGLPAVLTINTNNLISGIFVLVIFSITGEDSNPDLIWLVKKRKCMVGVCVCHGS